MTPCVLVAKGRRGCDEVGSWRASAKLTLQFGMRNLDERRLAVRAAVGHLSFEHVVQDHAKLGADTAREVDEMSLGQRALIVGLPQPLARLNSAHEHDLRYL